jgi:hypothetical protein
MIVIKAKRWFNRNKGNTYHSCVVFDDNKIAGHADFVYGYGEAYLKTAHALLQEAGLYPKTGERLTSGANKDYYEFLRDRNKFLILVDDVQRKKDL